MPAAMHRAAQHHHSTEKSNQFPAEQ